MLCIPTGYGVRLKTYDLKATTNPLKLPLGLTVTKIGGQYRSLWKELIGSITFQNGTFAQPLGKWKKTWNTQKREIIAPEKVTLYLREVNG